MTRSRRDFAKFVLTGSALVGLLRTRAFSTSLPANSAVGTASKPDGIDDEVEAILKSHFVIDTASSDGFYSNPDRPPHQFLPEKTLTNIGGAVLGIGGLIGQFPIKFPPGALDPWKGRVGHTYGPLYHGAEAVEHMLKEFEATYQAVEANASKAGIARSPDEMKSLRQAGKLSLVLGLDTAYSINDSLAVLHQYSRLGLRKVALTHEVAPSWAESCTGDTGAGLRPFGREVIAECNKLGIMVDLSHCSDATFWGAIECSKRPLIATHSGARSVQDNPRNLTDEMLAALVKSGGMIGVGGALDKRVCAIYLTKEFSKNEWKIAEWMANKYPDPHDLASAWLSLVKNNEAAKAVGLTSDMLYENEEMPMSAESTLEHLDYLIPRIGFDHVGVGTDLELLHPKYSGVIRGIVAGLLKRSYSSDQIAKILGGNFLRVFGENQS